MALAVRINDSEVQIRLGRLAREIKPRSVFRIAGEVMRGSIAETFLEEGFPARRWRRVGRGRSIRAGRKILTDSGRLQKSIQYRSRGRRLVIGTNLKYAAIHQFGGVIVPKRKKVLRFPVAGGGFAFARRVVIPARPYLLIKPQDPRDMSEALEEFLGDSA